ncbi:MAG: quinolinate synthase NadA [Candidatus Firestonebacteria bacterium]
MSDNSKLIADIKKLKKERNAIILVHNYQLPEVQEIADFTGDSLGLSRQAAKTDAKVIVFCGVYFMAETASILSPDKTVLLPEINSGCPMADMITAKDLRNLKKKYPGHIVVAYVNSSAEVKAETDYCCTSGNALKVVEKLKDKKIIFVPDRYLGAWISMKLNKEMILWHGYCPTHAKILPKHIEIAKKEHPAALVLVHPECRNDVWPLADEVCSTEGFLRYAKTSAKKEFIVATEAGMLYRLKKENPGKEFYPANADAICPNMKKNTLEKVLWALQDMKNVVKVPPEITVRAKKAIERMVEIA